MKILTKAQVTYFEKKLSTYSHIDTLIKKHEKINNHEEIEKLKALKLACEYTLKNLDELSKNIFELRYIHAKKINEIKSILNIHETTFYRHRTKIIATFADNIGIFI